jgi:chromosome segregation ATPase
MISVEQVRALEDRVEKAVAFIATLKHENVALRGELDSARQELAKALSRAAELEAAAETFRRDQASIEEGITHALRKLDAFEDLVLKAGEARTRPEDGTAQESGAERGFAIKERGEARQPAPPPATPEPPAKPVPAAAPAVRGIEELSLEELEAATAPEAPAKAEAPAAPASPQAAPAPSPPPVENELDIF